MVQAIKRDEVFIEPEGIHVETHQPERRSRKPPLLLVHGALTGSWLWTEFAAYLAERGWEAHAMNLRGHFTSDVAELDDDDDARLRRRRRRRARHLGRPAVIIGWGIGALAALMHAERHPSSASCCWRRRLRPPPCRAARMSTSCAPCPPSTTRPGGAGPGTREELRRADAGHGRPRPREDERAARWRPRVRPCPTRADGGHPDRHVAPDRQCRASSSVPGLDDVIHPAEARRTADLLGPATSTSRRPATSAS